MKDLYHAILDEAQYRDLVGKDATVTDLFPDWQDKKLKVYEKGGVRMRSMEPGKWIFDVHYGQYDGSGEWYKVVIEWVDLADVVARLAAHKKFWKKDGSGPDLRKLALKVFNECHMKVRCDCPAFVYWGYAFLLTELEAISGPEEHRPPDIRNPERKGCVCKHLSTLLAELPFYSATMANYLSRFYGDVIATAVNSVKQREQTTQVTAEPIATTPAAEPMSTTQIAQPEPTEPVTAVAQPEIVEPQAQVVQTPVVQTSAPQGAELAHWIGAPPPPPPPPPVKPVQRKKPAKNVAKRR
jgi:hypothetical protein